MNRHERFLFAMNMEKLLSGVGKISVAGKKLPTSILFIARFQYSAAENMSFYCSKYWRRYSMGLQKDGKSNSELHYY